MRIDGDVKWVAEWSRGRGGRWVVLWISPKTSLTIFLAPSFLPCFINRFVNNPRTGSSRGGSAEGVYPTRRESSAVAAGEDVAVLRDENAAESEDASRELVFRSKSDPDSASSNDDPLEAFPSPVVRANEPSAEARRSCPRSMASSRCAFWRSSASGVRGVARGEDVGGVVDRRRTWRREVARRMDEEDG